jgi:4-diphosphocytidyl-2-C-methyl-D-erythritol kinase
VVIFPHCKINLGLNITGRRPDGYHNLETCFYPLPFYDVLEVITATEFKFTLTGIPVAGDEADNLCVQAYRLLAADFVLPPVNMYLHKTIPTGAGLAGGSSDGTNALLLLNRKFNLGISNKQLAVYALRLGSDCPFFLQEQPMLGSGRGELLTPVTVSLKDHSVVLIITGIHISTKDAFEGISPSLPAKNIPEIISHPVETWKNSLKNDFEDTVFQQHPVLATIKEKLYANGAAYASLTGTGSVVYGIFKNEVPKVLSSTFGDSVAVKVINVI